MELSYEVNCLRGCNVGDRMAPYVDSARLIYIDMKKARHTNDPEASVS